jgi:GT2 family glycosyltransferase
MSGRVGEAVPRVSVVIPSRNRPELLFAAVRSVLAGARTPDELVVVDQSDEPSTQLRRLAREDPCVRYLWEADRGVSRARNAGATAATGDVVVFLDDDMLAAPDWLEELVGAVVDAGPRACVVGGVAPEAGARASGSAPSLKVDPVPAVYAGRVGADVFYANAALDRSALADVGGFDERLGPGTPFPAAEDNDLGLRLLEHGVVIRYHPAAVAHHLSWRTPGERLRLRWNYGVGQGGFYAKHLGLGRGYIARRLVRDVRRRLLLAAVHPPRRPHAPGDLLYLLGVAVGMARWGLSPAGRRPARGTAEQAAAGRG